MEERKLGGGQEGTQKQMKGVNGTWYYQVGQATKKNFLWQRRGKRGENWVENQKEREL